MSDRINDTANDAREQIAQLREQVQTLMSERFTPVLANAAGRAQEYVGQAQEYATQARDMATDQTEMLSEKVRESPLVELCERMLGKGYDLRIYDPAVVESALLGANRAFIEAHLPHLRDLLVDTVAEVTDHAEVLVVGKADDDVRTALGHGTPVPVIDLVRLPDAAARRQQEGYVGLAW